MRPYRRSRVDPGPSASARGHRGDLPMKEVGDGMVEMDVGHARLSVPEALDQVARTIARLRQDPRRRVLKIIHGQGRAGTGGAIRSALRTWLGERRELRGVVLGERYDIFDPLTQELRRACGQPVDRDLGRGNPGITLVWVR